LDVAAAVAQHEVVRQRLVVPEEVLLDRLSAVAEAEDELVEAERGVVLHDVPEDRPRPDRDHRLRQQRIGLACTQGQATAEEDDLHEITCAAGIGTTSCAPHSCVYASCSAISRCRFHGRMTITSGCVSASRSGGCTGMCVPGRNIPCLPGLRSTVYSIRSVRMPQ